LETRALVVFLSPRNATSNPRAKFKAQIQAILRRDADNSRPKKIFAILNLASCFQATGARTIE
jgi:hypothetical protein